MQPKGQFQNFGAMRSTDGLRLISGGVKSSTDSAVPQSRIGQDAVTPPKKKISMVYYIDESLLAKLKAYHVKPSDVIVRELKREVRRRERRAREAKRRQVVNRFSGEVVGLRSPRTR